MSKGRRCNPPPSVDVETVTGDLEMVRSAELDVARGLVRDVQSVERAPHVNDRELQTLIVQLRATLSDESACLVEAPRPDILLVDIDGQLDAGPPSPCLLDQLRPEASTEMLGREEKRLDFVGAERHEPGDPVVFIADDDELQTIRREIVDHLGAKSAMSASVRNVWVARTERSHTSKRIGRSAGRARRISVRRIAPPTFELLACLRTVHLLELSSLLNGPPDDRAARVSGSMRTPHVRKGGLEVVVRAHAVVRDPPMGHQGHGEVGEIVRQSPTVREPRRIPLVIPKNVGQEA
jgi:hypothetical protein